MVLATAGKIRMWHVVETWDGQTAADAYKKPLKAALKQVYPKVGKHIVLEDNDPTGCPFDFPAGSGPWELLLSDWLRAPQVQEQKGHPSESQCGHRNSGPPEEEPGFERSRLQLVAHMSCLPCCLSCLLSLPRVADQLSHAGHGGKVASIPAGDS